MVKAMVEEVGYWNWRSTELRNTPGSVALYMAVVCMYDATIHLHSTAPQPMTMPQAFRIGLAQTGRMKRLISHEALIFVL